MQSHPITLKTHFNIILISMPRSSKWSPSFSFPCPIPVCISVSPPICPHDLPVHLITWIIISGEDYKPWSSSLHNSHHPPVTSSLLGSNIFLSIHFLNIISSCSFLNLEEQVSHPYKTTFNIKVLYISILTLLGRKWEDKLFLTKWQWVVPKINLLLISSRM